MLWVPNHVYSTFQTINTGYKNIKVGVVYFRLVNPVILLVVNKVKIPHPLEIAITSRPIYCWKLEETLHCLVPISWPPDHCLVPISWPPDHCLVPISWPPDRCLVPISWPPDRCLVPISWPPDHCLVPISWPPDHCLVPISWPPDHCLVPISWPPDHCLVPISWPPDRCLVRVGWIQRKEETNSYTNSPSELYYKNIRKCGLITLESVSW